MQEKEYHIEQYSAATLQQYSEGRTAAATMHAIEKGGELDDPSFLADAIEGMWNWLCSNSREEAVVAQLASIRQQVQARTTVSGTIAPVRSSRWWRVRCSHIYYCSRCICILLVSFNLPHQHHPQCCCSCTCTATASTCTTG